MFTAPEEILDLAQQEQVARCARRLKGEPEPQAPDLGAAQASIRELKARGWWPWL